MDTGKTLAALVLTFLAMTPRSKLGIFLRLVVDPIALQPNLGLGLIVGFTKP